jgi:tRNA G26 N,N-dimethylase Trm1
LRKNKKKFDEREKRIIIKERRGRKTRVEQAERKNRRNCGEASVICGCVYIGALVEMECKKRA